MRAETEETLTAGSFLDDVAKIKRYQSQSHGGVVIRELVSVNKPIELEGGISHNRTEPFAQVNPITIEPQMMVLLRIGVLVKRLQELGQ